MLLLEDRSGQEPGIQIAGNNSRHPRHVRLPLCDLSGPNDDWTHPHDLRRARVTKMKDGRTHLAHKAEHAVDMETRIQRETNHQHENHL